MTLPEFEEVIKQAYAGRNRTSHWLASNVMIEAGELAELLVKLEGYGKPFTIEELVDEAGDVINFVAALLQAYGSSLEEAMLSNIIKLEKRGWVNGESTKKRTVSILPWKQSKQDGSVRGW